ncbi:MAG: 50S ribosomal protein L6 [Methyloprofundus sp.]|nr:50S ribosomal protein L6 [Methyloprofundus sp.]
MSRIANSPINIPAGVEVKIADGDMVVKGSNGELSYRLNEAVKIDINDNVINIKWNETDKSARVLAGTTRSIVNNMVTGVSEGFEKKLTLIGVGYRAQMKGKVLNLTLGFSHPIDYQIPEGITIETPSQTEIVIKGNDKQAVGQVAADIRAYRPPEPYKGKGVRYADEHVFRKEAKKK